MTWRIPFLIGLVLICSTLFSAYALFSSKYYNSYLDDIQYKTQHCEAGSGSEQGKHAKDCQSFLYRTLDDPTAFFTAALTAATIALFFATFGLYAAAIIQTRDGKDAGRAWIGAPDIETVQQSDGSYRFKLVVRNVGKSPVNGLYIRCIHVKVSAHKEAAECYDYGIAEIKKPTSMFSKLSVVPSGAFSLTSASDIDDFNIDFSVSNWEEHRKLGTIRYPGPPIIAGCVIYGPRVKGKLRKTLFWAQLQIEGERLSVGHVWTGEAT